MRTISKKKAIETAQNWHGGQWSALYQFLSSGVFLKENAALYIEETLSNIRHQETAPQPYFLPKYQVKELAKLIRYFLAQCAKERILVEIVKHPYYGYDCVMTYTDGVKKPMYAV